jgi:hypothetical protein
MAMAIPPPTTGKDGLTEQGTRVIIITSVMISLATVSVIARGWSRYVNLSTWKLAVEDWLVVGALIFTWGYSIGNILCKAPYIRLKASEKC